MQDDIFSYDHHYIPKFYLSGFKRCYKTLIWPMSYVLMILFKLVHLLVHQGVYLVKCRVIRGIL